MRFQAPVTTVSWIPSESGPGIGTMVFASGIGHYDDPAAGYARSLLRGLAARRIQLGHRAAQPGRSADALI